MNKKILYVDDSDEVRSSVSQMLARHRARKRRTEVAMQLLGAAEHLDQAIGAPPVLLQHRLQIGVEPGHRCTCPMARP